MVDQGVRERAVACGTMLMAFATVAGASAQQSVDIPGGNRLLELDAQQVYSAGSIAGADWETFGEVGSVAFDGEGNLYVLDQQNHRVVVVDLEGNFVRAIGKEGGGPGELRMPMGLVVAPNGTLAVRDMAHQAFVVYGPDGSYLHNARNDFQNGLLIGDLSYHPRGGAVGASQGIRMSGGRGGTQVDATPGAPVKFVSFEEGLEPEVLYQAWRLPPETERGDGTSFSTGGGGSIRLRGMPAMRAFEPPLLTAVLPDGRIVLADSSSYALKLLSPEGDLEAVLRRPIEPREVSRRDREAEKARRIEDLESGDGAPTMIMMSRQDGGGRGTTERIAGDAMGDIMRGRIENMVFADEIPVIAALAVDWEGRLWVERTGDHIGEDGPTDLITAAGQYLGTIAPDGVRIPDAFGPDGLMAYIERDEFDVPSVVVKRLPAIQ